jgi:hypothetical protein
MSHATPKVTFLAAADAKSREHCMRLIEISCKSSAFPTLLKDIAIAAALTRALWEMNSLSAIRTVLAVTGVAMNDLSLLTMGYERNFSLLSLVTAFGFNAVASVMSDISSFILVSPPPPFCSPQTRTLRSCL